MTRRHFGIRVPKPRPTYTCPARAGAWRGDAFIWAIVVILIVLGVVLWHGVAYGPMYRLEQSCALSAA